VLFFDYFPYPYYEQHGLIEAVIMLVIVLVKSGFQIL